MQIYDEETGKQIRHVWIDLTREQAREIAASIGYALEEEADGWHAHFEEGSIELTLSIGAPRSERVSG